MKPVLLFLAISFVLMQPAHGQQFTFAATQGAARTERLQNDVVPATFTSATFLSRRVRYPRNPKVKTGAILAITGGGLVVVGCIIGTISAVNHDQSNTMSYAGLGLVAAGGIVATIGGIMAAMGKMEDRHKYGWQIAAPKNNEIAFAYNF